MYMLMKNRQKEEVRNDNQPALICDKRFCSVNEKIQYKT